MNAILLQYLLPHVCAHTRAHVCVCVCVCSLCQQSIGRNLWMSSYQSTTSIAFTHHCSQLHLSSQACIFIQLRRFTIVEPPRWHVNAVSLPCFLWEVVG